MIWTSVTIRLPPTLIEAVKLVPGVTISVSIEVALIAWIARAQRKQQQRQA